MKAINKIFTPIVFQILILVITVFMQIPFIHYAYGGYVKYVLLFGVLVCIFQVVNRNIYVYFKDKLCIAMMAFAFLYAVTILFNRDSDLNSNIKQLAYMVIFFLLLVFENGSNPIKRMKTISTVVVICTSILSLLSFLTSVLNIYEWYILDANYYIGMFSDYRFWGLLNPNACGAIAVISMLLSLYLLFSMKLKHKGTFIGLSLLLVINILLQYIVLLLSSSRGAYYSFLLAVLFLVFVATMKNIKKEKLSLVFRTLIALTLCVALAFCILKLSTLVQNNRDMFCVVSTTDANNPEKDTTFENYLEEILKKYSSDSSAFSGLFKVNLLSIGDSFSDATGRGNAVDTTGRISIWKSGFSVFLQKPIFGWTREGLVEPTRQVLVESFGSVEESSILGGGLHNLYLTVLCSSGIVGFISFVIIVGIVLFRFIKRFLVKEKISMELLFSFALCMYFFVSELVESRILYTVSFYNVVFWIFFGFLNYFSLKGNVISEEKD